MLADDRIDVKEVDIEIERQRIVHCAVGCSMITISGPSAVEARHLDIV